jgi:transcriptional regulator with XRE-family HTH domain
MERRVPEPSPLKDVFAARLIEARLLRGLSQRALGAKVRESKAQGSALVNRYEAGRSFATLPTLEELARALEVPMASLLAETPAVAEAIRLLSKQSEATQGRMVAALQELAERT